MSAETALDQAKSILEGGNRLRDALIAIDAETVTPTLTTPVPRAFKVGSYLGREDILAELPAVTLETRNTVDTASQEEWQELRHTLWVWAFIAEPDPERLHRYVMRCAEALRRLLVQGRYWGGGWHDPVAINTLYTGVFQAGHRQVQGCRVEVGVSEIVAEEV